MDIEEMTLSELKQLRKKVDKAIETYEARQLAEARKKLEEQAREFGFSLKAVADSKATRNTSKTRKPRNKARYKHPENPRRTWDGNGNPPSWFTEALDSGMSKEDLKV